MFRYEPSPYHKLSTVFGEPPRHRPSASKCPALDMGHAQNWLEIAHKYELFKDDKNKETPLKLYYYDGNQFYIAKLTNREKATYHGYPAGSMEVPNKIKRKMLSAGLIDKATYRKLI